MSESFLIPIEKSISLTHKYMTAHFPETLLSSKDLTNSGSLLRYNNKKIEFELCPILWNKYHLCKTKHGTGQGRFNDNKCKMPTGSNSENSHNQTWQNKTMIHKTNINKRWNNPTGVRAQRKQGWKTEHSMYWDIVLNITIVNRTQQTFTRISPTPT